MIEKDASGSIKSTIFKAGLIFAIIIIFCIVLTIFYEKMGSQIFIFYFIPVALTAFFFGLWPALVMQTLLIVSGTFLLSFVFRKPLFKFFFDVIKTNPIGIISHYCLIALLGFMRDQHLTIKRLNKEIVRISKTDELTCLYNRRAILEKANQQLFQTLQNLDNASFYIDSNNRTIEQKVAVSVIKKNDILQKKNTENNNTEFICKREIEKNNGIFTCALFDIDHFKKINDSFGHLVGDKVLYRIGMILKDEYTLRKSDICGRYGGEEFLILFPGTSACNAICVVKRIIEKIQTEKFYANNGSVFSITVSTGISQFNRGDKDINEIIHRADTAMYYAKEHGRNQIIIYEEALTEEKLTEIEKTII